MNNKRSQGHYCRVCNRYKPNACFCGYSGFSRYLCKKCKSEPFSFEHMSILSILDDLQKNELLIRNDPHHYLSIYSLPQNKKRAGTIFTMNSYEREACRLLWDKIVIYYWRIHGRFPEKTELPCLTVRLRDVIKRDLLFDLNVNKGLLDTLYRRSQSLLHGINQIKKCEKANKADCEDGCGGG